MEPANGTVTEITPNGVGQVETSDGQKLVIIATPGLQPGDCVTVTETRKGNFGGQATDWTK